MRFAAYAGNRLIFDKNHFCHVILPGQTARICTFSSWYLNTRSNDTRSIHVITHKGFKLLLIFRDHMRPRKTRIIPNRLYIQLLTLGSEKKETNNLIAQTGISLAWIAWMKCNLSFAVIHNVARILSRGFLKIIIIIIITYTAETTTLVL